MPTVITSRDNPRIKLFVRLRDRSRERRENGLLVLEGARLCADAAVNGLPVHTLFVTEKAVSQYPQEVAQLRQCAAEELLVSEAVAACLSGTEHPQGVFAILPLPRASLDPDTLYLRGRYLALESVRDPGNLGTIVRTAEAFGMDGLLLSADCCDLFAPKVLRAAMGGTLRLPFAVVDHLPQAIARWRETGLPVYACVADAAATPVTAVSWTDGGVSVIGNEANGLSPETTAACTQSVTVPMAGRAESLNAAVAACLVMWEMTRSEAANG